MSKIQVIRCKCGSGKIFAGCIEPYCYTDKDWLKDLKKYVKEGHSVDMVNNGECNMEHCDCKDNGQIYLL